MNSLTAGARNEQSDSRGSELPIPTPQWSLSERNGHCGTAEPSRVTLEQGRGLSVKLPDFKARRNQ